MIKISMSEEINGFRAACEEVAMAQQIALLCPRCGQTCTVSFHELAMMRGGAGFSCDCSPGAAEDFAPGGYKTHSKGGL
jgi:hypothetical protein